MMEEQLCQVVCFWDLVFCLFLVNWWYMVWYLLVLEMFVLVGGEDGVFEELICCLLVDFVWKQGGLYYDDVGVGVLLFWVNFWFDFLVGLNFEIY